MKLSTPLRYWLQPETDEAIDREIDAANLRTMRRFAVIIAIVETIALTAYSLIHLHTLGDPQILQTILRVFLIILCSGAAFFLSRKMLTDDKTPRFGHRTTNLIVSIILLIFALWGMVVSIGHYSNGEQMVTFYTVMLAMVVFFRLRPVVSIPIVGVTSILFYIYLEFFVRSGMIHPFNYALLVLILLGGAIVSYRLSVNTIQQKNRIEELNITLEQMANHDSLTRLQNRYALNRKIPDFLGHEICLAMLDIDKFKHINDTCGHHQGDEVLRSVSDTMKTVFAPDCVYRYGGDEFLIIQSDTTMEAFSAQLLAINERLNKHASAPNALGISVSYGAVCVTPNSPNSFLEAIAKADAKLYEHKQRNHEAIS